MDIFQWLTGTTMGKCMFTMLVSMIPIVELRGGLPFGVALGLPYHLAFPAAVIGNIIPAPFIVVYIRKIFLLMRRYMPRLNGLSALMKLRERHKIPVIILSAKTEESDKVSGLTLGADDYISKPYNSAELIARVKAQLRRYHMWGSQMPKEDKDRLVNGGLVLDKRQRIAIVDGQETRLTAKEYSILLLLMEHPGQVFSAEQIYEHVWEESADFAVENTVMVHIRHIREKIEIDTKNPRYVKVVWGLGYKMEKYV